jgi:hypothetical protein
MNQHSTINTLRHSHDVDNFKNCRLHCTENPIYVFPEMKLCGLVPIPTFMYL